MSSKLRVAGRSRALSLLAPAAAAFVVAFSAPASAQSIAVVVNGQPILSSEVAARNALAKLGGGKPEKSAVDELIDEKLKLAEVKRYNMVASDSQVDQAYASIASRTKLSVDQFTKAIGQRGVTAQTLKDRLKAEISWAQFIRRKYAAQYANRDVTAALSSRGATASNKSTQYTLRQIIFVVPKGASDAQTNQRRSEAVGARGRFPGCDGAVQFAGQLRDVAVKDPVIRSSGQLGKEMTDILDKTKLGALTDPQRGDQGWEMIAVCEKKDIADDSSLRAQVMEEVGAKEAQAQADKYLAQLRTRAVIERR
ncbi:peptidylprolyl isomerase [Chenggangzhangella methanolivorans]|uniref:Peptidylprolyl isomerase n=1 Tax=Chenggangzhangella methanolivorans TaxID=1437009 RepID=A0A9E6REZ0_9HYPH|nr:peptidylprolyl isomerase [Chenggangzhangella methanolivorans]QZN99706.1 peptidylprolyl isomerase [Chenggangzhangella methanolivorans]